MQRPAEVASGSIGTVVGAIFAIAIAYGANVPDAVMPAVIVLVSWISGVVTYFVAKRRRPA